MIDDKKRHLSAKKRPPGRASDRNGEMPAERVDSALARLAASRSETMCKKELGAMLGVSTWTIDDMRKRGLIPPGIVIGRRVLRWRRSEILDWLEAGAPNQKTWQRMRKARA